MHKAVTSSPPTDPTSQRQHVMPPAPGNIGSDGAPTARHTSHNQDSTHHTSNVLAPYVQVSNPTVNDITSRARQVMHTQEEVKATDDAFNIISTNDYNTESDYSSSLSFIQVYRLLNIIHTLTKYSTVIKHLNKHTHITCYLHNQRLSPDIHLANT